MNRRLRNPSSTPSSRIEARLHRFLRPGALARIRDSKISSKSLKSIPLLRLSPPSSPSPVGPANAPQIDGDGFPCFAVRISGPRFPRRKKLAAPKYALFAPPSSEISESFLEAWG